ncbi:hypothetical protein JTB14_016817 [Gonioctena quinquepunctata]|nr:hypothetical protein JTB14_016817 [Gonioctena quinquepunctata]
MSSRSKKILSMVLKEPGTPGNGTLVDSNNIQNIEVITEDGFSSTPSDYLLEDSLQPKVFTELTNWIPFDDNLNISQHQIPIQNICQNQGGNANKGCFEFIEVSGPFQVIDNQLILSKPKHIEEGENEPEHMEERESEQEPTEDNESEPKHTENSENEAQHSEEGENSEKGFTKSGNPRKRRKIDEYLKQETIIRKREKLLKNHLVLPGCKCKQMCFNNIADDQRQILNTNFWRLSTKERKAFILNTCSQLEVERRTTESVRKQNTFKYKLKTTNGQKVEVSKKKIDYDSVDDRIESFQPFISHYRREHAPNRRYLPSDISISVMFEKFKSQYPEMKVSYEAYRSRIEAKNISFASLGHEECEQCGEFNLHDHQKQYLQKKMRKMYFLEEAH